MALLLMPMMALATTWYVNGSTGSDYNSGTSQSSAKATIQAAIDASYAGDTILVAPGTYAPIATDNKAITIQGTAGTPSTIIDAAGTGTRCVLAAFDGFSYGRDDSDICTNSVIIGFTLQNGDWPMTYGGGDGGCALGGTYKSCIMVNGTAGGGGNAAQAVLENCLLKGGRGYNGGNANGCIIRNCTLVDGDALHSGSTYYNCAVYNSICIGSSLMIGSWDWGELVDSFSGEEKNVFTGDPGFVDAANGDYRLAAGSPCIDAGDNSYATGDTDLAGNARIANGTVDIGCYEYGGTTVSPTPPAPTDGLVAYWPFDGNANDASGNGNHGTTHGVTLTTDRFGNANSAYYFGDGNYISVPDSASLDSPYDQITMAAWVRIDEWYWSGTDPWAAILNKGYYQYSFNLWGQAGEASTEIGRGMHARFDSLPLWGTWSHLAVTYVNGCVYAYLNGTLVGTYICSGDFSSNSSELQIGRHYPGAVEYLYGALDDLRIYNRALSAAEVKALYDGTAVVPVTTYTVTFDLNGADGTAPAERQVVEGSAVGTLPMPTREGYEFLGWHVGKEASSEEVTASTVVTGDLIVYAVWRINSYTVAFDANGGTGGRTVTQDYGTALTAPTVTRTGYTFTGWSPEVAATVPASDVTYTAQWLVNSYTVTFDANGGTGGRTVTQDYGTALTAPTVTRTGYTFTGWSPAVPSTVPAADATYAAQWRINSYTVTFDAQGGAGGGTVARNHGAALGELPVPTRDGFSFDGWFTAASGGTEVSSATVITGAVTFYAHWTEQSLYQTPVWYDEDGEEIDWTQYYDGDEEPFAAESAATFDGYVLDGEEVCGVVQVKVGKANKKTETAKVTAALTLLGDPKKRSYKGTMSKRGIAELTCSGKGNLSLCLGTNAMWGEVDGLSVSGARNVFAKAGDPKAAALSRWQGAYTLVLETVDAEGAGSAFAWGYSGLTLTVGAKGKVKVQGTMVDGAKVSVTAQLLVGEKRCCIPVAVPLYSKKGGFGLNLWLQDDGEIEAGELGAWDATASKTPFRAWFGEDVPVARVGAALPAELSFLFMGEPEFADAEALYDFVPWEVTIATGARWTLPAAGSVKYDRESEEYVDAKDSANPAGLKLTYVSKTGAFKGSFKLYAVDGAGRLKKLTANVSGVMAGRQGYGTATVKGVGSWPVSIQ